MTRNSNAGYRLPGALWAASQAAFQLDSSDQPFHEADRSPRSVAAVVLEGNGLSRLPQPAPSSDEFSMVSKCRLSSRLGRWAMTAAFLPVVCLVRFRCAELFSWRFLTTQSRQNNCLKSHGGGDGLIQSVRLFFAESALKRWVIQRVDEIVNAQSLTHVARCMRVGAIDQTFHFLC